MKMTTGRKCGFHRALLCTSALVFLPGSLAEATDFIVPAGTTETTTLTLPDPFDTLLIEKGGVIDTTGGGFVDSVRAINDHQTINNAGTINSGRIGILSTGADVTITTSGTINGGFGIYSNGVDATITNSGTINFVRNGIYSSGANAVIINSGVINAGTTGSPEAIFSRGAGATITNSGAINGVYGIYSSGDGAVITNSGFIEGSSRAINLVGGNAKTYLLAGSVLDGDVIFGSSGNTLNIGVGLNLYLDYRLERLGDLETVNSAIPFVHDEANTVVYTVDPTGFALAQSFVQTTADAVHQAVRTGSERGNRFGGGFAGQSSFAYGADAPGFETTGPRGWVSGFGGYQSRGASDMVTGGTQAYGGLVSGGGFASDERLYGAFAGGSYTQQETEYDTQEIDASSVFGGVYAGARAGALWVRGGLLGGYAAFSSDRTVANNTVSGGLETASADYGATFISPSLTIGRGVGERMELSLGGHYAALFVDGYSESGSAADLTVAARTVQVAAMRAKASYLAHQRQTRSGQVSVESWAGVDGVFNFGGDVDASVAAGAFDTFSASFFDTAVMGFAGLGVNHRSANGKWSLNASVEGRYGTNDDWDVKGAATTQMRF